MIENNFKCEICDKFFHESSYSCKIEKAQVIYLKKGRRIKCPACGSEQIISFSNSEDDFESINISKFSSLSSAEKKQVLRKRASEDTKKNAERIKHIDKNFTGSNFRNLGL